MGSDASYTGSPYRPYTAPNRCPASTPHSRFGNVEDDAKAADPVAVFDFTTCDQLRDGAGREDEIRRRLGVTSIRSESKRALWEGELPGGIPRPNAARVEERGDRARGDGEE